MIVWLASYPRSGNTYFRLLLHHAYGLTTYSVRNDPLFNQLGISSVVGQAQLPGTIAEMDADPNAYLVKTHGMPADNRPAIYLLRDGRDVIVSYSKFLSGLARKGPRWKVRAKALFGLDDPLILIKHLILPTSGREGWKVELANPGILIRRRLLADDRFGGWSEHVRRWTTRPCVTTVLYFEDLIAEPLAAVGRALDAVKWPMATNGERAIPSFEELHARWPDFFRRGKVGSWRDEMPPKFHELFWRFHGEAMQVHGYGIDGSRIVPSSPTEQLAQGTV